MTFLGKILIIINLVFALVTGFLIVSVFVVRTNWKDGYDKLNKNYEVARTNAALYESEAKTVRNEKDAEIKKKDQEIQQNKTEIVRLTKETQDRDTALTNAKAQSTETNTNTTKFNDELERRKQEVEKLQTINRAYEQQMVDLKEQAKVLRDRAVAAEIASRSSSERNQALLKQLENMTQDAQRAQNRGGAGSSGTTASSKNPPPEDVEGVVLETDGKGGLVTISIGSDSGVNTGNTLEVYRLKPRPEYVGTIRIVNAHHHEAVARPVLPLRAGPIQKGDIVASRITTANATTRK